MILLQSINQKVGVATLVIAISAAVSTYIYWTGRKKPRGKATMKSRIMKPEELQNIKWECVGRMAKIWLYPVKSCSAVSLQTAQAWPLGLTEGKMRDRSFMIMTEQGNQITGIMIGTTVLIKPNVRGDSLILKHPELEDLSIDLEQVEEDNKEVSSKVYGETVPGLDCGEQASMWLEKALKKKARLLYHANIPSPRKTEKLVGQHPLVKDDDNALYANSFPYMLMTKESIANLELEIERQGTVNCPISAENFRPNLLVEGTKKAFDEDDWAYIKIGDAIFRNVSPCQRCCFTTVDHRTGIKEPNMEPLRTLKKYRCKEESGGPSLGINLAIELIGTIRDDDEVFVCRFSEM